MWACICWGTHMEFRRTCTESVLSLQQISPGNWTQVVRPGINHPYPLNHLTGLSCFLLYQGNKEIYIIHQQSILRVLLSTEKWGAAVHCPWLPHKYFRAHCISCLFGTTLVVMSVIHSCTRKLKTHLSEQRAAVVWKRKSPSEKSLSMSIWGEGYQGMPLCGILLEEIEIRRREWFVLKLLLDAFARNSHGKIINESN